MTATHNPIVVEFTLIEHEDGSNHETDHIVVETMCDCTPSLWYQYGHQQYEFGRILQEEAAR